MSSSLNFVEMNAPLLYICSAPFLYVEKNFFFFCTSFYPLQSAILSLIFLLNRLCLGRLFNLMKKVQIVVKYQMTPTDFYKINNISHNNGKFTLHYITCMYFYLFFHFSLITHLLKAHHQVILNISDLIKCCPKLI